MQREDPNSSEYRDGELSPYTVQFYWSLANFLTTVVVATVFMRKPLEGTPLSWRMFWDLPLRDHLVSVSAGVLLGIANCLGFLGAGIVGVALSYAIMQSSIIFATGWGVFVFREYEGATLHTKMYIAATFGFLMGAIVLLSLAGG
eukprot:GFYU01077912.1.p1 GENE.GFYU01077912.1~~GFYU01077912.1.p1  ORF type:complete len:145 (+),score=15.84 GFYU01077912.1:1-435(+)